MSGISFGTGVKQRFVLQVKNILGVWEQEDIVFNCLDGAIRYGDNRFPQNEWRVLERHNGKQHAYSSPLQGLAADAQETLHRFQTVSDMRRQFEREREQREERRRIAEETALRQREALMQRMGRGNILDYWNDNEDTDHFVSDPIEAVDWVKEGF